MNKFWLFLIIIFVVIGINNRDQKQNTDTVEELKEYASTSVNATVGTMNQKMGEKTGVKWRWGVSEWLFMIVCGPFILLAMLKTIGNIGSSGGSAPRGQQKGGITCRECHGSGHAHCAPGTPDYLQQKCGICNGRGYR